MAESEPRIIWVSIADHSRIRVDLAGCRRFLLFKPSPTQDVRMGIRPDPPPVVYYLDEATKLWILEIDLRAHMPGLQSHNLKLDYVNVHPVQVARALLDHKHPFPRELEPYREQATGARYFEWLKANAERPRTWQEEIDATRRDARSQHRNDETDQLAPRQIKLLEAFSQPGETLHKLDMARISGTPLTNKGALNKTTEEDIKRLVKDGFLVRAKPSYLTRTELPLP